MELLIVYGAICLIVAILFLCTLDGIEDIPMAIVSAILWPCLVAYGLGLVIGLTLREIFKKKEK